MVQPASPQAVGGDLWSICCHQLEDKHQRDWFIAGYSYFCDVAEIAEKTNTGDIIRSWLDSAFVWSDIIQRISKLYEVFYLLVNKVLMLKKWEI